MKTFFRPAVVLSLLFIAANSSAQLYEVSLDEKVANSTLIAEGKVIDQTSFWNEAHTMIFTSNKIEVYKIFKGKEKLSTMEVLTQGGSVGGDYTEASDLLTLDKGSIGVFFCNPNTIGLKSPATKEILYDVYSSSQGFIKYDLAGNKAVAPFAEYKDIIGNFYKLLKQKTGNNIKVINSTFKAVAPKKRKR